ncbi:ester cyclase [Streptomyces cylindrosporus]|uniref:Ester cyclase n=1 Tax=Streptomyces cylindrosporus TaxID=2927583 RepID=A0ABS9XZZ5_9ACTN|nr:ester cyclase [Streptomyces cylindrosporus]MCI3269785.1 ester cyclase [Streptomyces cylindrosporus]
MGTITPAEMEALIGSHMLAEEHGDPGEAVASYTDDVEHDVVGFPGDPIRGIPAALERYEQLVKDLRVERSQRTHTYYSDDAATVEDLITAVVTGEFMGIPGNDRRITFRMLHVFEFKNGRISRENVWLDGASIAAQLTAA